VQLNTITLASPERLKAITHAFASNPNKRKFILSSPFSYEESIHHSHGLHEKNPTAIDLE
jgi:hypothetical protein